MPTQMGSGEDSTRNRQNKKFPGCQQQHALCRMFPGGAGPQKTCLLSQQEQRASSVLTRSSQSSVAGATGDQQHKGTHTTRRSPNKRGWPCVPPITCSTRTPGIWNHEGFYQRCRITCTMRTAVRALKMCAVQSAMGCHRTQLHGPWCEVEGWP